MLCLGIAQMRSRGPVFDVSIGGLDCDARGRPKPFKVHLRTWRQLRLHELAPPEGADIIRCQLEPLAVLLPIGEPVPGGLHPKRDRPS